LPWNVVLTQAFKRDFRKLTPEIRKRVEEAILELAASEDPRNLGHRLHGRWEGFCSYRIGRQHRVIYRVQFADKVIELVAAGTHKIYR
jgi:addiction module RelE/StbE family toxin